MDAEKAFNKLNIDGRLDLLKKSGEYVGSRFYGVYHVHLYAIDGFYVEVYYKIGLNLIHICEIQKNKHVLSSYTDEIDLRRDLGVDLF